MIKRTNIIITGIIACIIACTGDFLTLFILGSKYPGYSQLYNTMSSLGASQSPVSVVISAWWIILGVLMIIFAFGFKAAFSPGNKYVKIAYWLLILYGLGEGLGSGIFKADMVSGSMSFSYIIHDLLGGAGVIGILILPLVVLKTDISGPDPRFRKFSYTIVILGSFFLILFTFRFFGLKDYFPGMYTGLWQRLFVLMYYIYLLIIAYKMAEKTIGTEMNEKLLYKIRIVGRVQGVGFRWSAANEARYLGIYGFVRNMSDGSVYIEAEGSKEQLDDFVKWCNQGPGHGYVESVNAEVFPPANYKEFRIEH